jgi:hypothetical protein
MIVPDINKYREEKEQWKAAGQPVRSDERVEELYNICEACEHYIPVPLVQDRGQCEICTCLLSKDGDRMNKLRWATTKCPLPEPKWTEEPGQIQTEAELNTLPQSNRRKLPPAGCGCGE